jgi:hypothetical protein
MWPPLAHPLPPLARPLPLVTGAKSPPLPLELSHNACEVGLVNYILRSGFVEGLELHWNLNVLN